MKAFSLDLAGAILSSFLLVFVAGLLNWASCAAFKCIDDDGTGIAQAIPGALEVAFFLVPYWLAVFPLGWWLSRRWGEWRGYGAAVGLFALLGAIIFHSPHVDGSFLRTASVFLLMLGVPWVAALLFDLGAWRRLTRHWKT